MVLSFFVTSGVFLLLWRQIARWSYEGSYRETYQTLKRWRHTGQGPFGHGVSQAYQLGFIYCYTYVKSDGAGMGRKQRHRLARHLVDEWTKSRVLPRVDAWIAHRDPLFIQGWIAGRQMAEQPGSYPA